MFRIDSDGATPGNLFTEGDPQTALAATVVSADWLNEVQEEIIEVVEEVGIALVKGERTQLNSAILEYFLRGGRKTPITQVIANDTGPADVVGFLMNKSTSVAKVAFYNVERKTDTQVVNEVGALFLSYDSKNNQWLQEALTVLSDSGVVFSIDNADTDAAQLKYTSDDLTGASYVGNLKITGIFEIRT